MTKFRAAFGLAAAISAAAMAAPAVASAADVTCPTGACVVEIKADKEERKGLKARQKALKAKLKAEKKALKAEHKAEKRALLPGDQEARAELKAEHKAEMRDLKADEAEVKAEFRAEREELKAEFKSRALADDEALALETEPTWGHPDYGDRYRDDGAGFDEGGISDEELVILDYDRYGLPSPEAHQYYALRTTAKGPGVVLVDRETGEIVRGFGQLADLAAK